MIGIYYAGGGKKCQPRNYAYFFAKETLAWWPSSPVTYRNEKTKQTSQASKIRLHFFPSDCPTLSARNDGADCEGVQS